MFPFRTLRGAFLERRDGYAIVDHRARLDRQNLTRRQVAIQAFSTLSTESFASLGNSHVARQVA